MTILEELGLTDYELRGVGAVRSSTDPFIHPLDSPPGQQKYDPQKHPPKEAMAFHEAVYKGLVCYVKLRDIAYWVEVIEAVEDAVPLPGRAGRDCILFGAPHRAFHEFVKTRLQGANGVAVDSDLGRAQRAMGMGLSGVHSQLSDLTLAKKSARFVTLNNLASRQKSLEEVREAIGTAAGLATDFLFIELPYFDADAYLGNLGFKFFFSDGHGHTCPLKSFPTNLI